jgi:hypothetical protein
MSDNKNIRSKFESEKYLKNFIPNNEDKNRFFEFYEEQEIKKSLKEKFFSEQYIQSFKVSKKEWQLFEKTYLPSYWNYKRIALYVFFVVSILGGLIGYYYFHKLHDTSQSHLINASSIEKDKLNTEQKNNINKNTHSSNQIVPSKSKSLILKINYPIKITINLKTTQKFLHPIQANPIQRNLHLHHLIIS